MKRRNRMDPYKILGVSKSATDSEIKKAYIELIKKYHPDKIGNSPLNEIAGEKTAEVNAAFDEIMNMRRGSGNASSYESDTAYDGNSDYSSIRKDIQSGSITTAEKKLDEVPDNMRNAEWFFLKGSICYKRGWLNEAFDNFQKATSMDPANKEYKAAFDQMQRNRQGNMNGSPYQQYRTSPNTTGCSGCDMCQGLLCADCCCECMGGDLISCC